jgi:hypothetical protein
VSYRFNELIIEFYLYALTSNAVAIADKPLPSPVKPSPSVEVADTETLAPDNALDRAAMASARLGAIFGLLPTI